MVPISLEQVLLEYNQVFEAIGDESFIDAPIYEDDNEPMAGPVAREAKIADTTTPQVHIAPTTATSSLPPVPEKKPPSRCAKRQVVDQPNFSVDDRSDHMADEDTGPSHGANHRLDMESQMRLLRYDFIAFSTRQDSAAQRQNA
ncbi:hypothetical protein OWV82_003845 [Melia azedarach]|uniref:Uncharacterized protein n=1 Tax=Melia azedarach TaxID=155640 RepID=A0ACC1YMJ1_MELAZ|nr:hypothetical protein OWV82_003845 [Melia azedarach]